MMRLRLSVRPSIHPSIHLLMEFGVQGQVSGKFPDRLLGPPSLLSMSTGGLFPVGVKRSGREADYDYLLHSAWICISTPQYVLMARYFIEQEMPPHSVVLS